MGMICEIYIIDDSEIKMLISNPDTFDNYLTDNYSYIYGNKYIENETVFSMDKAWDIAKFLIKQNDKSKKNVLNKLDGLPISEKSYSGNNYILANEVIEINNWLSIIKSDDIMNSNLESVNDDFVYRAEWLVPENWNYILEHFYTFQKAFSKAVEKNSGIVISIG